MSSLRIQFRLGTVVPSTEYLDVGEGIFDPDNLRLGLGYGNAQPAWLPGIDRTNQDLVMFGSSLIRSEDGGARARFGLHGKDLFSIFMTQGTRLRVTNESTIVYNQLVANGGGVLSGDFRTDGGRFTDMNVQEITISNTTKNVLIRSNEDNSVVGRIDHQGITSKSQQDFYLAMAAWSESIHQFFRNMFSSGLVSARQYSSSRPFDNRYKPNTGAFSAMSIHNHMDWRGLCGMAEIQVLVNGYPIQTRHNDYRMMHPIASETFGERVLNQGPPVPADVTSKALGYTGLTLNGNLANTQVQWMRNIYLPENNSVCVWELTYLEAWVQKFDGNVLDIASSTRHSNDEKTFKANIDYYNQYISSGLKPPIENVPMLPGVVRGIDANGHPFLGYVNWRISSIPVGNLSSSNSSVTMNNRQFDLRALPFDQAKAAKGIIDATNRFKLRRSLANRWFRNGAGRNSSIKEGMLNSFADDIFNEGQQPSWETLVNSRAALFDCVDLEHLCSLAPGFDGIGVYTEQFQNDPNRARFRGLTTVSKFSSSTERGLNYYSNIVNVNGSDASGFQSFIRGFNDTNLFTAYTKHEEVIGNYSFMIPLELVIRTPRENWNPFNVPYQATPTGNGTYTRPYSGWNDYGVFYTMPLDAFGFQQRETTQADTGNRAWVTTPSGVKEMFASGIRTFDVTGERRRFPIVPDSVQFSGVGRDMEWLKFALKKVLRRVASGTVTDIEIDDAF